MPSANESQSFFSRQVRAKWFRKVNIEVRTPRQISRVIENKIEEKRIFHHSMPNTQIKIAISRKYYVYLNKLILKVNKNKS